KGQELRVRGAAQVQERRPRDCCDENRRHGLDHAVASVAPPLLRSESLEESFFTGRDPLKLNERGVHGLPTIVRAFCRTSFGEMIQRRRTRLKFGQRLEFE